MSFETNRLVSSLSDKLTKSFCTLNDISNSYSIPYCDPTTREVVAFHRIYFDPKKLISEVSWVDPDGNTLGGPPAGSGPCSIIPPDDTVYTANPEYFVLSGIGSWSMPSNVSAISIYVADLGVGSTPTLTTDSGTRPIYLGQKLDWSVRSNNTDLFVDPVLTVTTTHAEDIITITYIVIT